MAYAMAGGMNLRIDSAGRIILPKHVRDRFGLNAGSALELEERPDGLVLRPAEPTPSMVRRNGRWVHLGKAPRGFRWNTLVDGMRDERIKEILGL
jgi:AbrB family looped-hinge helix DNA binding protein